MSSSPKKPHLVPRFKPESIEVIMTFIKQKLNESKAEGVVIGLSGGLDSAVVTKLCSDALGSNKVLVLIMPESATSKEDLKDALGLASALNVEYRTIDISEMVEGVKNLLAPQELDNKAMGNIKARCRMILLYIHANLENRLVMGTSNKSELLTGYFTKFGDGGADFSPIGDLYKTQIQDLAKELDIPDNIIAKPPSAGLWEGQTDECELKIRYQDLDSILHGIELRLQTEDIASRVGIDEAEVLRIQDYVEKTVHKRKMPLIPKIGIRTLGLDWRE
jgi:NAD+ synthase